MWEETEHVAGVRGEEGQGSSFICGYQEYRIDSLAFSFLSRSLKATSGAGPLGIAVHDSYGPGDPRPHLGGLTLCSIFS